jgi:hypothetical protein
MKALSIKQPWAWLICKGYKDIENRNWSFSPHRELPMKAYIHASRDDSDLRDEKVTEFIYSRLGREQAIKYLQAQQTKVLNGERVIRYGLSFGALIGEVVITGCVKESKSPWFVGPYGFVLANPVLYDKPIPYRGQLGLFEVSPPKGE